MKNGDKMTLSEELNWRGFSNQTTYENITELDKDKKKFYLGVDPSADSMTIGNLAAIMMAYHFVNYGHEAFFVVGGATGMIGDPDGKKDERNIKNEDEIKNNAVKLEAQFNSLFKDKTVHLVNNYAWFKNINYIDFLHDIGKHVSTGQMLNREFIKSRLGSDGSGISYAEFSYVLIQAYDFLHLFREYGVSLQLCGADQWGNAIAGVDLIRRLESEEADVFSTPLVINKATGVKFGKSEGGAIWLDPNKTSVYKFYQFWLNVDDADVIDLLKIYTLLSREKIDELGQKTKQDPGAREAQKALAYAVTEFVHGKDRADSAKKVTEVLFGGADFKSLNPADLEILASEIPVVKVGTTAVEALAETGLAKSNGEARRLIAGGAISINGEKISDDIKISEISLIKKGKNSFILVK